MSDDVSPELIKSTQKILGKYVKKPQLTEKLLKKPPFKFLHDVISCVVRDTGFLKGLYTDVEMQADNVKDKEAKIQYLTKLIEAVKTVTGLEIKAKPSKIIAGLEPSETNLLLQAIGTALEKKLDSTAYVSQHSEKSSLKQKVKTSSRKEEVKKTNSKTNSRNEAGKESNRLKRTDDEAGSNKSDGKRRSSKKESSPKIESSPKDIKEKAKLSKKEVSKTKKDIGKSSDRSKGDNKESERSKLSNKNNEKPGRESGKSRRESKDIEKSKTEKENEDGKEKIITKSNLENIEEKEICEDLNENETIEETGFLSSDIKETSKELSKDNNDEQNITSQEERPSTQERPRTRKQDNLNETTQNTSNEIETSQQKTRSESVLERPKSAKPRSGDIRKREASSRIKPVQINHDEKIENEILHSENLSNPPRPKSSLRPPSVRPSSARPGAPRLRPDSALPLKEVVPMGKIKVIVENYTDKEADEEETVIIQNASEIDIETSAPVLDIPADKGHLVEQILEQLHEEDMVEHTKAKVDIDWEEQGFKGKDATTKEISQLRNAIQSLTRTANPLGKLMNFLHEDLEAMQSELNMWINMKRQFREEIARQKKNNEDVTKPLKKKLLELNENIQKEEAEISALKASILKNDLRIKELLVDM